MLGHVEGLSRIGVWKHCGSEAAGIRLKAREWGSLAWESKSLGLDLGVKEPS
jgi:hypothetical protein